MKFGKTAEEAEKEAPRGSSGGFMKYPKEGDNVLRILDEPDKWVYYWEHFNPNGFSYPCTNDRDTCPGCTSDNAKEKKASRKVAFNAFDGTYTNVWKVPKQSVADKLKARFERIGTILDRDYLIRQIKTAGGTDYDVEGMDKEPLSKQSLTEFESFIQDPEELLASAYEEAQGDGKLTQSAKANTGPVTQRTSIQRSAPETPQDKVVTEEELRAMDVWDLVSLAKAEGYGDPPQGADTTNEIVDWMLQQPPF